MKISTPIHHSLSPNQARISYDLVVALLGALAVQLYHALSALEFSYSLYLCAPGLLAVNSMLGVYGRYGVGAGSVKAWRLATSIFLAGLLSFLVSRNLKQELLWAVLIAGPVILPRVFLNLNRLNQHSLIVSTVKRRGPVLVVGGGGYIGSLVVERLLNSGYPVRILDRFFYGSDSIRSFQNHPKLEVIEGDVTDIYKLPAAMDGASAVVHLAGLVGDPACAVDSTFTRHTNIIATRMLKDVALSLGVPRFVFASSCSVYGSSNEEVDETSQLNPVSLYAQTKIDSERELLSFEGQSLCMTILRFATVFGHSLRPRFDLVANLFVAQAFVDGKIYLTGAEQWRPFVHVRDLANAILLVLRAREDLINRQVFNVGDSKLNMQIGQLAELVQAQVSKHRKVEILRNTDVDDRRNYMVSFSKIHRALGFRATTSMEEGVQEILNEFERGNYRSYKEDIYSNLATTRKQVENFRDPMQSARLYQPVANLAAAGN